MATILENVSHGSWGDAFASSFSSASTIEGLRLEAINRINGALGEMFAVVSEAEDAGVSSAKIREVMNETESGVQKQVSNIRKATSATQISTATAKAIAHIDEGIAALEAEIERKTRRSGGSTPSVPSGDDFTVEDSGPSTGALVGVGLGLGALGLWLLYRRGRA